MTAPDPTPDAGPADPIRIRPMRPEDVPGCAAVVGESWQPRDGVLAEMELDQTFRSLPRPRFYVHEADGRIVGLGGYGSTGAGWTLYALRLFCVSPAYRRRGIAQAIAERCFADTAGLGLNWIIETDEVAFWRRFGFETEREIVSHGCVTTLMIRPCLTDPARTRQETRHADRT